MRSAIAAALVLLATGARADIAVRFQEGAPKDRFSFENRGACVLTGDLRLDLESSRGGLVFDVSAAGAGVEVFQPFDLVEGADHVRGVPVVADGDRAVVLRVADWPAGARIAFTIDVDDTLKGREITVSDAEIAGATVAFAGGGETRAVFAGPSVMLPAPPCP